MVVATDRVDLVTDVIVVRVWSWTLRLDNFHVTITSTERVLFAGRVQKHSELLICKVPSQKLLRPNPTVGFGGFW